MKLKFFCACSAKNGAYIGIYKYIYKIDIRKINILNVFCRFTVLEPTPGFFLPFEIISAAQSCGSDR